MRSQRSPLNRKLIKHCAIDVTDCHFTHQTICKEEFKEEVLPHEYRQNVGTGQTPSEKTGKNLSRPFRSCLNIGIRPWNHSGSKKSKASVSVLPLVKPWGVYVKSFIGIGLEILVATFASPSLCSVFLCDISCTPMLYTHVRWYYLMQLVRCNFVLPKPFSNTSFHRWRRTLKLKERRETGKKVEKAGSILQRLRLPYLDVTCSDHSAGSFQQDKKKNSWLQLGMVASQLGLQHGCSIRLQALESLKILVSPREDASARSREGFFPLLFASVGTAPAGDVMPACMTAPKSWSLRAESLR